MESSISPSKPSRRKAITSRAMVAPPRSEIGLERAFLSPFLSSIWIAQATTAKSGAALRMISL